MTQERITIQYMSTDDLIPYINNPRINYAAVDKVAESIRQFGFKVPIIIDSAREIVTGHTRLQAAKQLGMEQVPVIVADDLNEEQVRTFRLVDNKVAEFSEWDEDLLIAELAAIEADLEAFGLNLDDSMQEADTELSDIEQEDEEEPNPYDLKKGDIYLLDQTCSITVLEPTYVADIIKRWEKETGDKAVKLN